MKTTFRSLVLFCSLAFSSYAQRVVPEGVELVDGNSSSFGPFLNPPRDIASARYQQVYDSSQFYQAPGFVTEITFRTDNSSQNFFHGFFADPTSFQLNLSTTAKAPDSLSPVFVENVGTDNTVVYGPRSLFLTGDFQLPRPAVQSFSINIFLDHPFYYDPRAGNLLMDMLNYSPGPQSPASGPIDAVDTFGDSVSSLLAYDVNAASGTLSTKGLVTEFYENPVPEPSILALVGAGLVLLISARFGSKRSHRIS